MTTTRPAAALALATLLFAAPAPATAQGGDTLRACDFATCGVRIHDGRILQGSEGRRVGGSGLFEDDVRIFLVGPDSAAAWAERFQSASRWRTRFGAVGLIGMALAADFWQRGWWDTRDDLDASQWIGLGAELTGLLLSAHFGSRASEALGRSAWWYNEGVAEGRVRPDPELPEPWPPHYARQGAWVGAIAGAAAGLALVSSDFRDSPAGWVGYVAVNALIGSAVGSVLGAEIAR